MEIEIFYVILRPSELIFKYVIRFLKYSVARMTIYVTKNLRKRVIYKNGGLGRGKSYTAFSYVLKLILNDIAKTHVRRS